jgi:hypothetical protein
METIGDIKYYVTFSEQKWLLLATAVSSCLISSSHMSSSGHARPTVFFEKIGED